MKTKDSAVQWIEVNIEKIVKECGGDIGPTSRHRYALHIFEGIAAMYSDMVIEEYEKRRAAGDVPAPRKGEGDERKT